MGAKCFGVPTVARVNYIRVPARFPTVDVAYINFDMANRRNIELEDLDPIDKKKLIGRFEVFQSGVSDLKKAAEGEEPLFSLEDEP